MLVLRQCFISRLANMPRPFLQDVLANTEPPLAPPEIIFEDEDEGPTEDQVVLQVPPEVLSDAERSPSVPPQDDDPCDATMTSALISEFYADLIVEASFWTRICVKFYSSRETLYHLCFQCCSTFLYTYDVYVYFDYVSYHLDCFRSGYFCSFCRVKLYEKTY